MSNRCSAKTNSSHRCRLSCMSPLSVCNVHAPDCSICLEKNGTMSHVLPCGHAFHIQCIGTWYTNDRRCPMCRHYDKPKAVKIFYEEGLEPIEHSIMRPLLTHLVDNEILQTEYVGVLQSGELIQRSGEVIGYLWGEPRSVYS
jgi:hypothetical protein